VMHHICSPTNKLFIFSSGNISIYIQVAFYLPRSMKATKFASELQDG